MIPQLQAAVASRPQVMAVLRSSRPGLVGPGSAGQRPAGVFAVVGGAPRRRDPVPRVGHRRAGPTGPRASARRAYELARTTLGRDDVLAAELGQLALAEEDFAGGVQEWMLAVRRLPGYRSVAINSLSGVAERNRPAVLRELEKEGSAEAQQTAASLRARWGDPIGGFRLLAGALPAAQSARDRVAAPVPGRACRGGNPRRRPGDGHDAGGDGRTGATGRWSPGSGSTPPASTPMAVTPSRRTGCSTCWPGTQSTPRNLAADAAGDADRGPAGRGQGGAGRART